MRCLAIVNSECLNRFTRSKAESFLKELESRLGAEVVLTEYKNHVYDILKKDDSFDTLLSCGGDGTTFEIINAIDFTKIKLAVVPIGSGNSLAHDLGINSLEKAIEAIETDRIKEIDVAETNFVIEGKSLHKYFLATAALAFFADVVEYANNHCKNLNSGLCYPAAATAKAFEMGVHRGDLVCDGIKAAGHEFTDILVNNTAHSANVHVFKEASLYDKRLNIWSARLTAAEQLLWNLSVMTKTYFYCPGLTESAKHIILKLEEPAKIMLDGEVFGPVSLAEFNISKQDISVYS
jgi:diacylglycerol kinase family enzyme